VSIFDHPDQVPGAPSWRCPYCRTLQAEATQCWSCLRSAVECGTCRHYQSSISVDIGYCGLDRDRTPLEAEAVRSCWQSAHTPAGQDGGLFDEAELLPEHTPPASVTEEKTEAPAAKAPAGHLVEAPAVPPARQLQVSARPRLRRRS